MSGLCSKTSLRTAWCGLARLAPGRYGPGICPVYFLWQPSALLIKRHRVEREKQNLSTPFVFMFIMRPVCQRIYVSFTQEMGEKLIVFYYKYIIPLLVRLRRLFLLRVIHLRRFEA